MNHFGFVANSGAAVALAMLTACTLPVNPDTSIASFSPHRAAPQNRLRDTPVKTPSPAHFLTVEGVKPEQLEVWLSVLYMTRNPSCNSDTMIGALSETPPMAQVVTETYRAPAGASSFRLQIPLDRYAPGDCRWAPALVQRAEFDATREPGPVLVKLFAGLTPNGAKLAQLSFTCSPARVNTRKVEFERCEPPPSEHWSLLTHQPLDQGDPTLSTDGAILKLDYREGADRGR